MLDKEFQYYLDHQNELLEKYNSRFIVIVDEKVVGDYDNFEQAFLQSIEKKYELGTFLIQECTPGNEAYTQIFHSRAIFA